MKKIKNKKGFTIGEVMVAVFILTFGIISAVFLSAKSIATITDSRDAIIAASLAQEGVELVRSVRDNSVTQSTCGSGSERCTAFDMATGYAWPSLASGGGSCNVDFKLKAATGLLCGAFDLTALNINTSDYTYSHDTGTTTPFKRIIFIDYVDAQTGAPINSIPGTPADIDRVAAKVTSVVTWKGNADLNIGSSSLAEANCKIGKQCAIAQTKLTSWINFGE
ncbi:MAG: hypothetical protein ACKUBY_01265 [Candidatus Moraniibacteriota bacterium]|jgi:type II secretory pathway pseudopilin PulG